MLQESYLGNVKVIYIDLPYNTGKDFIYLDDFKQSLAEYDEETGVFDENENRLFKNTSSNGRFVSFPKKRTEDEVKKQNKNNIKMSNVRLSNN